MDGFISYAHHDHAAVDRLMAHLKGIELDFGITFWTDHRIRAGQKWHRSIQAAIGRSDVFLNVLSPDWINSGYIATHERPAIARRSAAVNGLVIPVLLKPCHVKAVAPDDEVIPTQAKRPHPISRWPDEDGYHAAFEAIYAAIRDHWGLTPLASGAYGMAVGAGTGPGGVRFDLRGGQLALVTAGGSDDAAVAEQREAQQDHALALKEARALAAALERLHNQLDPDWDGLLGDAGRLLELLDRPTAELVAELIPLWSASIKVGKRLLDDRALRDLQKPETTPLPKPLHDALDMTARHVAPFIRAFPSVLARDEATGAFLRDPALFERSRNVIRGARDAGLLEPTTGAGLTDAADFAAGQGPQQDKARAFTVAAGGGLVTRITGLVGAFVADPVRAGRRALMGGIGRFLRSSGDDAAYVARSQSPDIQAAAEAATETARTHDAFAETLERDFPAPGPGGRRIVIRRDAADLPEMVRIDLIPCPLGPLEPEARHRFGATIPPGTFAMGIPDAESKRESSDDIDKEARPAHLVTIPRPFWLGRFPVTRGEFAAFVKATGYQVPDEAWTYEKEPDGKWEWKKRTGRSWSNPGFPLDDSHPVTCINHDDALAYVNWVNQRVGTDQYRLPSEAEWEYAARAGTATARYWGDGIRDAHKYANMSDQSLRRHLGDRGKNFVFSKGDDGHVFTSPVGSFEPNRFDLHDTLGNVWEWCADPWHDSYDGAPDDGSVWVTNGHGVRRVRRGGSWVINPRNVRSGVRDGDDSRVNSTGCRLARTSF